MWLDRLEHTPLLIDNWLRHQRRDAFWQHGSVCEDFAAIQCAVYAVGGWADGYSNAIPRLLAGLTLPEEGPDRALGAQIPAFRAARPADRLSAGGAALVGPLAEGRRDRASWTSRSTASGCRRACRRGSTTAGGPGAGSPSPPGPRPASTSAACSSTPAGLARAGRRPTAALPIQSPMWLGLANGEWCPHGLTNDLPADQRFDDGAALCFETAPLAEGSRSWARRSRSSSSAPTGRTRSSSRGSATSAADGATTLVTYGVLNLTHRDSHAAARAARARAALPGARPAQRRRARLPAGPPPPARALQRLLADRSGPRPSR